MKTSVEEEAGFWVEHIAFVAINLLVDLHPSAMLCSQLAEFELGLTSSRL
jgi:hypothetical protein